MINKWDDFMSLKSVQNRIAQLGRAAASFWSCAFLLAFAGCGLFELNHDDRIVIGKSIDGVEIYDSPAVVQNKLGKPASIALGDFAGFVYEYRHGALAGLNVLFVEFALPAHDQVVEVTARAPYSGTTRLGVGIGSSKAIVWMALGRPDAASVSTDWHRFGVRTFEGDIYLFNSSAFVFNYDKDNLVESVRIILLRTA